MVDARVIMGYILGYLVTFQLFHMPAPVTNPPKKTTLPIDPDRKVLDWWGQYVESPKYKQRLSAFYQYPDYVQKKRAALAGDITVRENTGTASRYYPEDKQIAFSGIQAQAAKADRDEVLSHEIAHSTNSGSNAGELTLSPAESKFIMERNKLVSPSTRLRYEAIAKESGKPISAHLTQELHDYSPAENHSDIQALRFLMKKRGIYDAGQENLSPEILKKAMGDHVIKRSSTIKRLKDSFDDKALLEIMNKVAKNKSINKSTTA